MDYSKTNNNWMLACSDSPPAEYDYHHAMAQHAAVVSAANGTPLHAAMAQIPMLPTGLNLSMSSANQAMASSLSGSLANSNTPHHVLHSSSGHGGGGGGKSKNKKPKVNKDGIPAPKRATTAYINFTQWYREELKKAGRQIPRIGDFGKECAGKWNAMSDEDKQPFLDTAAKDRERYKREMAVYKPAREEGKPKRPGTAFMLFMADFRKEMAGKEPEGGVAALAKLGGERWRNMTEDDKRPYVERQNEEKLRYEQSMEEFRRKQSAEGPLAKQPRHEEPQHSQDSSDSQDNPIRVPTTSQLPSHSQSTPGSGGSTPTPVSTATSSPPAPPMSTSPTSAPPAVSTASPTPTLPHISTPMSLAHTIASPHASSLMGYAQHTLPNFPLTATNYNQAHTHTTMPGSPYLPSGATYTQAHLPGHYSWT